MPRAHRFFLPGYVWHITHRCHQKDFLLKFARDRQRWRYWLFQARKRYKLSVLNYIVTSNHIHLLVRDQGKGEIAKSMQLIAGRTAQEYNQRKHRNGAFWEDRYHATAVDTEAYLARCMAYIDLNMVRTGKVKHPIEWLLSGYSEIQNPPSRYSVIDLATLLDLFRINNLERLQQTCREQVDACLQSDQLSRDSLWSNSIAVGRPEFISKIKASLESSGLHRESVAIKNIHVLREPSAAYTIDLVGKMARLSGNNTRFIQDITD